MTSSSGHPNEYNDTFVAGLEWVWGEGYLSPGGAAEVAEIIKGINLNGMRVLDIGCGLGAIDVLLVRQHGAKHVTGIDVEQPLVDRARKTAEEAGCTDRIDIRLVEPGPLPFDDAGFDLVFSKDSIIHIPDKLSLFKDIYRVLKSGGHMALSDWLGTEGDPSETMQNWLNIVGLTFRLATLDKTAELVKQAGFVEIRTRDRNEWYKQEMQKELALISGDNFPKLVESIGQQAAEQRLKSSSEKLKAVEQGELRPGHIRAMKP